MKRKILLVSIITLAIGMTACKPTQNAKTDEDTAVTIGDNSQNSLDWEGTYSGVIPCVDCDGIGVQVNLKNDNTYNMTLTYRGKGVEPTNLSGAFSWNKEGNTITLAKSDYPSQLFVGENQLFVLDKDGKKIMVEGIVNQEYILAKIPTDLVEKHWKLIELMGEPVTYREGEREAFITFKAENCRVHGNFGCNTFNGSYEIKFGDRIKFSQMISTMMMCTNMELEQKFGEVLRMTDNYNLNGDVLVFNKARMAPLARFEAVYAE